MHDTPPRTEALYRRMLMERSGVERLKMGFSMYATARQLVEAGLRSHAPAMTEAELRVGVLRRFYGGDLPARTLDAVARVILETSR